MPTTPFNYALAALTTLSMVMVTPGWAQSIPSSHGALKLQTLRSDLHHPWGMTFLNQEELLVTERRGQLWRVNLKTGSKQEVVGLPTIQAKGQGGLLDVKALS